MFAKHKLKMKLLILLLTATIVAVTNAIVIDEAAESEFRAAPTKNRPSQPNETLLARSKSTVAATLVKAILLSTTASPPSKAAVNGTDNKPAAKSTRTTLENHPVLRAIHSTVCYGLPKPKPIAKRSRAVQQKQAIAPTSEGLFPKIPILSDSIQMAVQFLVSILPSNPWLSPVTQKLSNITTPAEAKQVFVAVKARLYRNAFRTATSLMLASSEVMVDDANRALNSNNAGTIDKLCAQLTEAEQEAMDFRNINKRGLDDNGKHDPEEVSDGEDDDENGPTWF